MGKKLVRILITMCLFSVVFTTTALATEAYPIWVAGTQVTDENRTDIPYPTTGGGEDPWGHISYDPGENMLTLQDVTMDLSDLIYEGEHMPQANEGDEAGMEAGVPYGIKFEGNLSIYLNGDNTIIMSPAQEAAIHGSSELEDGGLLTFNGNSVSMLTVSGAKCGIENGVASMDGMNYSAGAIDRYGGDIHASGINYGVRCYHMIMRNTNPFIAEKTGGIDTEGIAMDAQYVEAGNNFTATGAGMINNVLCPPVRVLKALRDDSILYLLSNNGATSTGRRLEQGKPYSVPVVDRNNTRCTSVSVKGSEEPNRLQTYVDANGNPRITIEANFSLNLDSSKPLDPRSPAYQTMMKGIPAEPLMAVELKLEKVSDEPIHLTFQVGAEYAGQDATVLHQLDNGELEVYNDLILPGGSISISTRETSPFIVLLGTYGVDDISGGDATTGAGTNPDTGSDGLGGTVAALVISAILAAALVYCGRADRKRKG